MNPIEEVSVGIRARIPAATADIVAPRDSHGRWMLDVEHSGWLAVIAWAPKQGFGITARPRDEEPEAFGEGPHESHLGATVGEIVDRVVRLMTERITTSPPRAVLLRELRAKLGLSQVEVAKRSQYTQGALSKLERRGDISMSALVRMVTAMGGELELWVRFPDDAPVRLLHSCGADEVRA